MTSYCSLLYLMIFLPGVILVYSIAPRRLRPAVLLLASYAFFAEISGKLAIYLLGATAVSYLAGLRLSALIDERDRRLRAAEKEEKKSLRLECRRKKRQVLAVGVLALLGILVALKYSAFLGENGNVLLRALHLPEILPVPSFVLPIGISFYTLQAVSYLADVHRETIPADKNPVRLALYLSFFPQIMEGPICRYAETSAMLWQGERITFRNLTFGIQRIIFGLLKKMVIADRLNILIRTVFDGYEQYDGGIIAVAMFFYTCQLYMEFSGTMDVVAGSGEIFGVKLPENFRQPFLARSIRKFWSRWHITLGTWFKDYVFYPLSVSKGLNRLTVRARKRFGNQYGPILTAGVALLAVWLCNGLWHGAGWNYIFFGMYHFAWIMFENLTEPPVRACAKKWNIDRESVPWKAMQVARTVVLVNIGELFFRAETLSAGFAMFGRMTTGFSLSSFWDGTILTLGMDSLDFLIAGIAILLVLGLNLQREKGVKLREWLAGQRTALRWAVLLALILFVVIFGAYGQGYIPVDPIYANF